jgi:general stress protein 26
MAQTAEHVWDLLQGIPMALLVTRNGAGVDARPMGATARPKDGAIYVLANKGEDSDRQIQSDPAVTLSFQKGVTYVVVHGTAAVSDDRAKIADLWNAFDKAWWTGPDDPRICLITIAPVRCEYWESPGKFVAYTDMILAAAVGTRPTTGEHGSVKL